MADDPKLVVALEARLNKFEKQMREAGLMAERGVRDVEEKFARANPSLRGLGTIALAIGAIGFAAKQAVDKVVEFSKELADLGDAAKRIGVSAERLQDIKFAASVEGISDKQATSDLEKMATLLNDAQRNENELTKILDENNIKYKDRAGKVIDINAALHIAADLIKRAGTELDKVEIAKMLGLSKEWVKVLEDGPAAFEKTARGARDAGGIIDNEIVKKAQDFDRAWNEATAKWVATIKAGAASILPDLQNLINKAIEFANALSDGLRAKNLASQIQTKGLDSLTPNEFRFLSRRFESEGNQATKEFTDAMTRADERARERRSRVPLGALPTPTEGGPTTAIPSRGGSGGGGKDGFERQVDSIQKHIAAMEADAEAVGKGAGEQARLRAEAALTEALLRSGIEITDEYAAKIDNVAQAAGAAAAALEKARDRAPLAQFARDAQNLDKQLTNASVNAFKSFEDNFADFVLGTKSASEAFKDMANSIIRDLIRIAVRQAITGPLASALFSFGGTGGGFFGIGGGKAAGGPVSAGMAYPVGERGPELFVPRTAGQIIPNSVSRSISGGGGFTYAPVIDARGADVEAVVRLERVVKAQGEALRRQSKAMLSAQHFNNYGVARS